MKFYLGFIKFYWDITSERYFKCVFFVVLMHKYITYSEHTYNMRINLIVKKHKLAGSLIIHFPVGLGRISGFAGYLAGYRILKLSGQ